MKIEAIAQNPEFAAARAEIGKLDQALAKVRLRRGELSALLSSSDYFRDEDANISAALAFAETGRVKASPLEVASLHEESQALAAQEGALVRAIERQQRSLDRLVGDLSERLARDLRPMHASIAKRYLDLMQKADQILEEEAQLLASIEGAGYKSRLLGSIFSEQIGRLKDSSGSVAYYLYRDVSAIAAG